jgi:hypothetical protein
LLFTRRFRRSELMHFARQLGEANPDFYDPRYETAPGDSEMQPAVHLHQPQSSAQWIALTGMLTIQMLVLALLAWRMLAPPPVESSLAQQHRNETYREILGGLALGNGAPGIVQKVEELGKENLELRTSVEGQAALIKQLQDDQKARIAREANLQQKLDLTEVQLQHDKATIDNLRDQVAASGTNPAYAWLTGWPLAAGTALLGIVLGFAAGRFLPLARDWGLDERVGDSPSTGPPSAPSWGQHEIHDE